MIIILIFMIIFSIALCVAFFAEREYKFFFYTFLFLIFSIISSYICFLYAKKQLKEAEFEYYPVKVITQNGNRYIELKDGIRLPDFTIPEGRKIVYEKIRDNKSLIIPMTETLFVLNEGD